VPPKAAALASGNFEMHLAGDLVMNEYERVNKLFYDSTGRPR
jgi:hypothetical protein